MKLHQVGILLSVFGIVGITTPSNFNNVQATIPSPTIDINSISFRNNDNFGQWGYYLGTDVWANGPDINALFEREADGSYWNYFSYFDFGGMEVIMEFNRSNSGWISSSFNFVPYLTNKIGSDGTVGSTSKLNLQFDNQTSNDHILYLDISSTGNYQDRIFELFYNNFRISDGYFNYVLLHTADNTTLMKFYLPSFSTLLLKSPDFETSTLYLNAWYLQDIGTSQAFIEGYDVGESAVLTSGGMFGVMSTVLTGANAIFSIPVFGPTITLGTLALFPLIGVVVFFFKKVIQ
jgi:hypothetical protein